MFWRDNNAGYTTSPFAAGMYDEQTVLDDWDYYNAGNSVAIPLTDAAFNAIGFTCQFDVDKLLNYQKDHLVKRGQ
jgi:hypothetical protein